MHGLLRCNINAGVHTRGRNGRVTQRCHNSPDGKRGYRVRVKSHTGSAWRFWGFWKSQLSWVLPQKKMVDFRGSQRPDEFARYERCTRWEGRWKSQNRKNVYLSPYVEEPLNSKVIKSFVPELRSRKCFSCFEIPVLCIYVMNILCTFHTYPYHWYGTLSLPSFSGPFWPEVEASDRVLSMGQIELNWVLILNWTVLTLKQRTYAKPNGLKWTVFTFNYV